VPRDQWCPPTRVGKASNRPSVLLSIARQNCDWDTLRAMHLEQKPSNNSLGSRSQTSALQKKDRDLDHAHAMSRGRTRVGGSTDVLSSCLTEQTRRVVRSRWVWWRTWVLSITCLTKRHLGSLKAANWVSFDFYVSYSSCWGYSLINTLKLKK